MVGQDNQKQKFVLYLNQGHWKQKIKAMGDLKMYNDLISKSELLKRMDDLCGEQRYLIPKEVWDTIEKFPEQKEHGSFLKLPCSIGDTLYVVRFEDIETHEVTRMEVEESGAYLCSDSGRPFCRSDYFGKTVFLRRMRQKLR